MVNIYNLFNEPDKLMSKKAEDIISEDLTRTPADEFHAQVEDFYKINRRRTLRNGDIRFSPSGVTKCGRELYYYNLDTPADEENIKVTPWKQRIPRNGEGIHQVTQNDYLEMHDIMTGAGVPFKFRMLEVEKTARKEFDVNGVKVVISGRCDGILQDIETGLLYIWEKKTKDKYANFKKVTEPTDANKAQAVCYSLLFEIPRIIFEYESLQKPRWTKDEEKDQKHFYFEVTKNMEEDLLKDLAEIAQAIDEKTPPYRELDKCMFCHYKTQCKIDGR